jgi:hypothetical protein
MVPVDFELDPVIPERVNNILPSDLTEAHFYLYI